MGWSHPFEKGSSNTSTNVIREKPKSQFLSIADDEYAPIERVPTRKSMLLVQQWVNTGLFWQIDYVNNNCMDIEVPKNKLSLLKQSGDYCAMENEQNCKEYSESLSCSSVDTAAYILANANITKGAEATAIIEGAKIQEEIETKEHNTNSESAWSSEDIFYPVPKTDTHNSHAKRLAEVESFVESSIDILSNKSWTESNVDTEGKCNGHTNEIPSQQLQVTDEADIAEEAKLQSTESEYNIKKTNLHKAVLKVGSPECENRNVQVSNPNIGLKEPIEKALKHLTNNIVLTLSHNERDSAKSVSESDEFYRTRKKISEIKGKTKSHCKKMYSVRDSQVDPIHTCNSIERWPSQENNILPPAPDPVTLKWKLEKHKLKQKQKCQASRRRKKWSTLFSKYLMNSARTMGVSTKKKSRKNTQNSLSMSKQTLNSILSRIGKGKFGRKRLKHIVIPLGIRKFTPERIPDAMRKLQRGKLNMLKRLIPFDFNSVVVLGLSDGIVYKNTLQKGQSIKTVGPVVSLKGLSETEIQKCTNFRSAAFTAKSRNTKEVIIGGGISGVQRVDTNIGCSRTSVITSKYQSKSNINSNLSGVPFIIDYRNQNRIGLRQTRRKSRIGKLNTSKQLMPLNFNAVVVLERLSDDVICKYAAKKREETKNTVPVISSKRFTESEIQKSINTRSAASTTRSRNTKSGIIVGTSKNRAAKVDPSGVQYVDTNIDSSKTSVITYNCGNKSNIDSNLIDISFVRNYINQNRVELQQATRKSQRGELRTLKQLMSLDFNAAVVLDRLSDDVICKYAAQKREVTKNMFPVVSLERLTETEIQKYTNSGSAATTRRSRHREKGITGKAPMTKAVEVNPSEVQCVESDINRNEVSFITSKSGSKSKIDSNLINVSSIASNNYQNRVGSIKALDGKNQVPNLTVEKYSSDQLEEKENVNRKLRKSVRQRVFNESQKLGQSKVFKNMESKKSVEHSEELPYRDCLPGVLDGNQSVENKENNDTNNTIALQSAPLENYAHTTIANNTTVLQSAPVKNHADVIKARSKKTECKILRLSLRSSRKYTNQEETANALVSGDAVSCSIKSPSHMQKRKHNNTLELSNSLESDPPLAFQTSLIPLNYSDCSNDPNINITPAKSGLINSGVSGIKRNRSGFITLSSDEEDTGESIMQYILPRKKARLILGDCKSIDFRKSSCRNKLSDNTEFLCNKTENLKCAKSIRKEVFRSTSDRYNRNLDENASQDDCISDSDEDLDMRIVRPIPESVGGQFVPCNLEKSLRPRGLHKFGEKIR